MCRSIKTLFNFEPPVADAEVHAAARQFVRKISGFAKPSKSNEAAFLSAIDQIAAASRAARHAGNQGAAKNPGAGIGARPNRGAQKNAPQCGAFNSPGGS